MNFYSDNVSGVSPQIMSALLTANCNTERSYGEDLYSKRLEIKFSELFETAVKVFPVVTGTAANALAMSVMASPSGVIYCHEEAHMYLDEHDAPKFYTGGAKMIPVLGRYGKIQADELMTALNQFNNIVAKSESLSVVSLTQATESGTVYKISEIQKISEITHSYGLSVHMDGARFANALARLGCSPADVTWRSGVDVLSFGVTKNGGMSTEAVIFFNQAFAESFLHNQKRYGHLLSKTRFSAVQIEAYLADNLWLRNAHNANQMAEKLAIGLKLISGIKICTPVEANEVFVEMPEPIVQGLLSEGFIFYRWERGEYPRAVRLVTSFNTTEQEINVFIKAVERYSLLHSDS